MSNKLCKQLRKEIGYHPSYDPMWCRQYDQVPMGKRLLKNDGKGKPLTVTIYMTVLNPTSHRFNYQQQKKRMYANGY